MQLVQRMTPAIGLSSDEKEFSGYAIVFYQKNDPGTEYKLSSQLTERISKEAANNVLNDDVIISYNHDFNTILGKTGNNTAELSIDNKGVKYRCEFDKQDSDHVRIARKIERGLVSGSSFSGYLTNISHTQEGNTYIRNVENIKLHECGPVVKPAYTATSTGFRSIGDIITEQNELAMWLTMLEIENLENL